MYFFFGEPGFGLVVVVVVGGGGGEDNCSRGDGGHQQLFNGLSLFPFFGRVGCGWRRGTGSELGFEGAVWLVGFGFDPGR